MIYLNVALEVQKHTDVLWFWDKFLVNYFCFISIEISFFCVSD